jgi:hypothetical protein
MYRKRSGQRRERRHDDNREFRFQIEHPRFDCELQDRPRAYRSTIWPFHEGAGVLFVNAFRPNGPSDPAIGTRSRKDYCASQP